ncbi:MAG TPA: hypothetical protein VFP22_03990, partial [Candidatus Limnocylindrales bacterium]|nr:hypothetical protein [Candidatus Limnocylindrales bacterium]
DGLLAIAEPSTEGRLAASLARHGAGAQGRYARPTGHRSLAGYVRSLVASGGIASRIAPGPFGPSVLVVSRSVAGPHLVVVDADAAIRPASSPVPSSGRDSDD